MRFMTRWRWENIWLVWTVTSLWLFPLLLIWLAVPDPVHAYANTSWPTLLHMAIMGVMWGVGVLMIGMSFPLVGVAVGGAVGLGCAAATGSLLPLLYFGNSVHLGDRKSVV